MYGSAIMMASVVRVSPIAIFGCVCVAFIILYVGKYILFPSSTTSTTQYEVQRNAKHVALKTLLEVSIHLAEKGGSILKNIRETNSLHKRSKGLTNEGVVDPVTEGDMLSHRAIVGGFTKVLPHVHVVSEEHEDKSGNDVNTSDEAVKYTDINNDLTQGNNVVIVPVSDVLVWVDPLDATKEYTENLLEYVTTMICIVVKGVPVAGVVHQPFLGKTSWAWVGHGHSSGLLKLANKASSMDRPRIIVSRSHAGSVNQTALKAFGNGIQVIPAGGAGFKVLSLFNGESDAYIHKTLIKKWDICAGHALLRSFGGKMTTLEGREILYGDKNDVKNTGGLLATLKNHQHFLKKLSGT